MANKQGSHPDAELLRSIVARIDPANLTRTEVLMLVDLLERALALLDSSSNFS
jgi:hypothetical protein